MGPGTEDKDEGGLNTLILGHRTIQEGATETFRTPPNLPLVAGPAASGDPSRT